MVELHVRFSTAERLIQLENKVELSQITKRYRNMDEIELQHVAGIPFESRP